MGKVGAYLLVLSLSVKWMFKTNLGDKVKYKERIHTVCNGVRCGCWRLDKLDNGDEGWVSREDCRKVKSLSNLLTSFRSGYRFYMGYWYGIWSHSGVEPWMKACQIW